MHKKLFIFYFLLLPLSFWGQADSIIIKGKFPGNTRYAKVMMMKFEVGSFPVGAAPIQKDSFLLALPATIEPGVYRFRYATAEPWQYLDIIINGREKDIRFSLLPNQEQALPVFTASDENREWYAYKERSRNQLDKIGLLYQFINTYPDTKATVIKAALQELEKEKRAYMDDLNQFKITMHDSWAAEMVVNRPYYFSNPLEHPRVQDYERREHFWDGFHTTSSKLINTPLYSDHILAYLQYWMNPDRGFSDNERREGLKQGADYIIRKFSGNPQTKEFAYRYLSLGFKEIGEEEVLQYLDQHYKDLAGQCLDEREKTAFEKRMEGYMAMMPGSPAPDFVIHPLQGNKANTLYQLDGDKKLIVFWSATCPHCLEEMPVLNEWAGQHPQVTILAVSIDTDSATYMKEIKKYPNMIHSCDYKGWDTGAAAAYYIAATPTAFLVNRERQIAAKYSSVLQAINEFK